MGSRSSSSTHLGDAETHAKGREQNNDGIISCQLHIEIPSRRTHAATFLGHHRARAKPGRAAGAEMAYPIAPSGLAVATGGLEGQRGGSRPRRGSVPANTTPRTCTTLRHVPVPAPRICKHRQHTYRGHTRTHRRKHTLYTVAKLHAAPLHFHRAPSCLAARNKKESTPNAVFRDVHLLSKQVLSFSSRCAHTARGESWKHT